jgi:hypothetical protein
MKKIAIMALGACLATGFVGTGFAQSKMTDAEKASMTKCKGMAADAMKGDATCAALMKKYPADFASPASPAKDVSKSR